MRKQILLFFVFMSAIIVAQDFAPVGATWHYSEEFSYESGVDYIKLISVKDTLFHGKTCRKITKRHKINCNDRPEIEYVYTSNDTVFFYDPNIENFQVLYDFSAEKLDSWVIKFKTMSGNPLEEVHVLVDSVDRVTINGADLKRMYVTYSNIYDNEVRNQYSSVIIENIGDEHYMFNFAAYWTEVCDGNFSKGLRCYEDDALGLYKAEIIPGCEFASSYNVAITDVYDHYCESANPNEIDTSYFRYNNGTLFIRNVEGGFCAPETLKATVKTIFDDIVIDAFNPSGVDCLAECSYGYTIKLPMAPFDTKNITIGGETFVVVFDDLNTSVKKLKVETLKGYPNPVKDILTLNIEGIEEITILNLAGKVILQKQSAAKTINLSGLEFGTYIIKVRTKYNLYTNKIMKE